MVNGQKIAQTMREKGITYDRMAEIVGVSKTMLSFITTGKREPNIKTLSLIAKELSCTVDDLLI